MAFDPTSPSLQAANQYGQLVSRFSSVLKQLAAAVQQSWNFVWNNQNGLTPQQVLTLINNQALLAGSSAAQVLAADAALITYMTGISASLVPAQFLAPPTGKTVTANADGTVTVS